MPRCPSYRASLSKVGRHRGSIAYMVPSATIANSVHTHTRREREEGGGVIAVCKSNSKNCSIRWNREMQGHELLPCSAGGRAAAAVDWGWYT